MPIPALIVLLIQKPSKVLQGSDVMNDVSSNPNIQPLSILVVDDDELNQRMMRLILKRDGHLVECVSNGLEAFNAVKSQAYDMVLMDLQMPVMDGVEASRRIREWEHEDAHIFIVALTASYLPERGAELFEAGIDNYMPKPFNVSHLRNILQYGLENRKFRNTVNTEQPLVAESSKDRKSTRLNSSHIQKSRMPSSA